MQISSAAAFGSVAMFPLYAATKAALVNEILDNQVGRFGLSVEVADTVVFIRSPRAAYITSADIRVDGGSTGSVN